MESYAVTGTRSNLSEADREAIGNVLKRLGLNWYAGVPFHHGDAKGVDLYTAGLVEDWGLQPVPHPADWDRYGKPAGAIRNRLMLDIAQPELLFAFPRKGLPNKGTLDCVKAAVEREINHLVVWLEP